MVAIQHGIIRWVNGTARAAYHYSSMTRYGFSVSGDRPLKGKQRITHFLRGLGYSLLDILNSSETGPNLFCALPARASAACPAPRPKGVQSFQPGKADAIFMKADDSTGGESSFSIETRDQIFGIIKDWFKFKREADALSFKEIRNLYKDTGSKIGESDLRSYLEILEREKKILKTEKGSYRVYNQTVEISRIIGKLNEELLKVNSLQALVALVAEEFGSLFEYVDLYLAGGDKFQIVSRSDGQLEWSKYAKPGEAETTISAVRLVNPKKPDEYLDKDSHTQDALIFQYPAAPMLQGEFKTDKEICGAWSLRENNEKGDTRPLKPLYSPNDDFASVENLLRTLSDEVAKQIKRICKLRGKDAITLWDEEEKLEGKPLKTIAGSFSKGMNPQEEIDFWTRYSDYMHIFFQSRDHRQMGGEVANLLRLDNGNVVVDAGCGVGNWFRELLLKGENNLELKGFDMTPAMIEKAKANFVSRPEIEFKVCDWCEKLPYADSSVDKIASVLVFGYLANPDKALAETLRVLKPGGVFALTVTVPKYNSLYLFLRGVWHSIQDRGIRPTLRDVPYGWQCVKFMRAINRKIQKGIYRGYLPEGIESVLKSAGFTDVTAVFSRGSKYFTVASGRKST